MKMKNLILIFLFTILSACFSEPPDCDQAMMDRFLRTELPYPGYYSEEFGINFSEYVSLLYKATWESEGGKIGNQVWKIVEEGELCLVYLETEVIPESDYIETMPVLSIQIEKGIIFPEDGGGEFLFENFLWEGALEDGVPLSP